MTEEGEGVSAAAEWAGVFFAGGLGASLRVLLSGRLEAALVERLPFAGVLIVNLLGCLLIGLASAAISASHWRNIVLGGLLGGFTTYSAYALFTVTLAEGQRWGVLTTQLLAHTLGGIVCVWAGLWLGRTLGWAAAS